MNIAKFLQVFGLVALMACVSLVTQSLTIDSIQKESKEERINSEQPFIGEIVMFGGNYAPRGWAFCDGQLLPIPQHTALFSILGTTYGGDGRTTFGLPDLRGRTPIHAGSGNGPGLTSRQLGSKGGAETVTLNIANLPNHSHNFHGHIEHLGLKGVTLQEGDEVRVPVEGGDEPLNIVGDIDRTGGSQAIYNMQPFQTVNFIISLEGLYPPRR